MKIKLVKLNNISNYEQWLQQTVSNLDLSSGLRTNLLNLLHERDALGSVQISEHVIMPHIVTHEIAESIVIVSQLIKPVSYFTSNGINTAIYIFSYPDDSSIISLVNCLVDEKIISSLQDPTLSSKELKKLFNLSVGEKDAF
ncbi:PTS sugar transporter subunit IIA [uncultured Lactobacillus sp.]|uniref:PTS sugar transporter subunit IIA n=1 Tax=uncultured Lactobacillus sp. TaxID=153152 RepID=UPI002615E857|nr:PTS sugar transporter subunit IIA [uncultured Lactobacillus sp.]